MNQVAQTNKMSDMFGRTPASMFPGFFPEMKHDHYKDFGFPREIDFNMTYNLYRRNGFAKAAIDKTIGKTWVEFPWLLEKERDTGANMAETVLEKQIRQRFAKLKIWQKLREADTKAMVGKYAGLILRIGDGKALSEPADTVKGLDGLLEVIPVWEKQLTLSEWDRDTLSATYGEPIMWEYNEELMLKDSNGKKNRNIKIHASRVVVWSKDGTVNGMSSLEPGYNDFLTLEKVIGAGGEGFWKNARSSPVLSTKPEANLMRMAKELNVEPDKLHELINKQFDNWQQGFDKALVVQGMDVNAMNVSLPLPEQFVNVALQSAAASYNIPLKIMVGTQTGERASTEDAKEWSQTNNSRRANETVPNILTFVDKLVQVGVLRENDEWFVDWDDLTEASVAEKFDLAKKMSEINAGMKDTGEHVFVHTEMREVAGYEPLSPAEAEMPDHSEQGDDDNPDANQPGGKKKPGKEPGNEK